MVPKISLAIDNCFASKRWTKPEDWMLLIRDLGLNLVEASADTECDPLYMGREYLQEWITEVRKSSDKTGVRVVNMFSGHGTYSTLGLTHTNNNMHLRFRDKWLKVHADTARALNAGMGFFAHGIDESVLQNPEHYRETMDVLYSDLGELALYSERIGLANISVEQMYSPHQPPWTISGTKRLINCVYEKNKVPMYITIDLGHMNGQQYFQKPSLEQILDWLGRVSAGEHIKSIWLGPKRAMEIFNFAANSKTDHRAAAEMIQAEWESYDYMFADPRDGSVSEWLTNFACYSPIIHLQQSDGKSSPHWSFSPEKNEKGIIDAGMVLTAIMKSYKQNTGVLPVCENIVLTLEPFIGTAANTYDALYEIEQSVVYWRKYVPYDGMPLNEITKLLD